MANEEHLALLGQAEEAWNQWRAEHRQILIDLTKADLTQANLYNVNLAKADLTQAQLDEADLTGANLTGVDLTEANLSGAVLAKTFVDEANLTLAAFVSRRLWTRISRTWPS